MEAGFVKPKKTYQKVKLQAWAGFNPPPLLFSMVQTAKSGDNFLRDVVREGKTNDVFYFKVETGTWRKEKASTEEGTQEKWGFIAIEPITAILDATAKVYVDAFPEA